MTVEEIKYWLEDILTNVLPESDNHRRQAIMISISAIDTIKVMLDNYHDFLDEDNPLVTSKDKLAKIFITLLKEFEDES